MTAVATGGLTELYPDVAEGLRTSMIGFVICSIGFGRSAHYSLEQISGHLARALIADEGNLVHFSRTHKLPVEVIRTLMVETCFNLVKDLAAQHLAHTQ